MGIEDILGLSKEEISKRVEEEKRRIPTIPGDEYLKQRLKRFQTPEWEFLSYLAHNSPETLERALGQYADYDGNEARAAIIESLRERYILGRLYSELIEKNIKTA